LAPLNQKELQKMLTAHIIAPTRYSSWVANLVVVRKKNGEIKLCVDFRNLNRLSFKDNYLVSNMEHLLQRVTGLVMLSMLDDFLGYNYILVKYEDQHKTDFRTPWGKFEYKRMPFSLLNAGSTFPRAMDFSFRDITSKIIEIYRDDLMVFSKDKSM
jgi:hypothetical protein